MKGLSDEERRALVPIGPPGEFVRDAVFGGLMERGLRHVDGSRGDLATNPPWGACAAV